MKNLKRIEYMIGMIMNEITINKHKVKDMEREMYGNLVFPLIYKYNETSIPLTFKEVNICHWPVYIGPGYFRN